MRWTQWSSGTFALAQRAGSSAHAEIHQGRARAAAERGEHADLAVLHFAEPSAILPLHPDRRLALLGERTFVHIQRGVGLTAQRRFHCRRHLGHHRRVRPRRVADELLQVFVITLGYIRFDALDILAALFAEQAAQVVLRVADHVFAADDEVVVEHLAVGDESARQRARVERVIFLRPPAGVAPNWCVADMEVQNRWESQGNCLTK